MKSNDITLQSVRVFPYQTATSLFGLWCWFLRSLASFEIDARRSIGGELAVLLSEKNSMTEHTFDRQHQRQHGEHGEANEISALFWKPRRWHIVRYT
jgi:hypothetical protein